MAATLSLVRKTGTGLSAVAHWESPDAPSLRDAHLAQTAVICSVSHRRLAAGRHGLGYSSNRACCGCQSKPLLKIASPILMTSTVAEALLFEASSSASLPVTEPDRV